MIKLVSKNIKEVVTIHNLEHKVLDSVYFKEIRICGICVYRNDYNIQNINKDSAVDTTTNKPIGFKGK